MTRWLVLLAACGSQDRPKPQPAVVASDAASDAAIDAPVVDAAVAVEVDAAPALPKLATRIIEGPFASIAAYCKTQPRDQTDEHATRSCNSVALPWKAKLRPTPPFEEARFFLLERMRDEHCQLGIKVQNQWWIVDDAIRCLPERAKSTLAADIKELAVRDYVPGGNPELVLRIAYEQSMESYDPVNFDRSKFESLMLCGVADGVPICTRDLPLSGSLEEHAEGKKPKKTRFKLDIVAAPGRIDITGDTTSVERYLFDKLAPGSYELPF